MNVSYLAYKQERSKKIKKFLSFSLGLALSTFCVVLLLPATTQLSFANPQGGSIAAGSATITQTGTTTTIQQTSGNAIYNWQTFNIANGETTRFIQPNSSSIALNRINPANGASQIYGKLLANGQLILINGAGIYFGPTAYVNVGSIIASTADISNQNFLSGVYSFNQPSSYNGSIINAGTIQVAQHGLVALMANGVVNSGYIEANAGQVVLASGSAFIVGFDASGLINFAISQQTAKPGLDQNGNPLSNGVSNSGLIKANGGSVLMTASAVENVLNNVVNMSGVIQVNSVRQEGGQIILSAGTGGSIKVTGKLIATGKQKNQVGGTVEIFANQGSINLSGSALINVSGSAGGGQVFIGGDSRGAGLDPDANYTYIGSNVNILANASTNGNGGNVVLWSNGGTQAYGNFQAEGGSAGGNGGSVETSGGYLDVAGAQVNTSAPQGAKGTWLLDPENVTIESNSGLNSTDEPTGAAPFYAPNAASSIIDVTNLETALGLNNVTITTSAGGAQTGNITVADNITWSAATTLTLSAYANILVNSGVSITSATAGAGLNLITGTSGNGTGTVTLSGVGATQITFSGANSFVNFFYNPTNFPTATNYTTSTTTGKVSVSGGAVFTPYMLVNSAANLTKLAGTSSYWTSDYALSQNISATINTASIGNATTGFTGLFNGQGYVVTLTDTSATTSDEGLFGRLTGTSSIINVGVAGTLTDSSTSDIGGLVGLDNSTATTSLSNDFSTVAVTVTGNSPSGIGDLVGSSSGIIANSYSTGAVLVNSNIGSPYNLGGLVGSITGTGSVSDSYSTSTVTARATSGTHTATSVGGLVGLLDSTATNPIINDYATGNISISGGTYNGTDVGGLVGQQEAGGITDSYSLGSETIGSTKTAIGGFVGLHTTGTNAGNFWNTTTSDTTTGVGSGSATGISGDATAAMQTLSTFTTASWNLGSMAPVWGLLTTTTSSQGESYPYLVALQQGIIIPTTTTGTINVVANGTTITPALSTTAGSSYYLLINRSSIPYYSASPLLLYTSSGTLFNVALSLGTGAASNPIVTPTVAANTIQLGGTTNINYASTNYDSILSNELLGLALGSISSTDVLYSLSSTSSALTLGNSNNTTAILTSTAGTTYFAEGTIATVSGGTTSINALNGPVYLNAGSVTTSGIQTYNGAVILGANDTLTTTNANVSFGSTVNGGDSLTVAAGTGTVGFTGAIGTITPLTSLTSSGNGAVTFSAAVGSSDGPLDSVSIMGATYLNGGAVYTAGNQTYSGTMTLGSTALLNISGTNALSLAAVNGAGFGLTIDTAGTATQTGVFSNSIGNSTLTINGTGTVTLTQANTYSGITTLNAGLTEITNNNGLGTAGVTVNAGGELLLSGVTLPSGNTLSLNGTGVNNAGALATAGTTTNTVNSTVTLAGATTIGVAGSGSSLTLPYFNGSGDNLTLSGAGTVSLTSTTALQLATSSIGNLTLNTGALTQTGALTVSGTSSFTAGANAITLTQNNALTGTVSLNNSGANAVSLVNNSALILGASSIGSGDLNITASGNISETGAITQAASATGVFTLTENTATSNITLNQTNNINGTIAFATGATLANVQDFNLYNINASASVPTNFSSLTALRDLTLDFNNAAIALPTLTLNNGGALSVTAGGAITQTGVLTVPGTSSFVASANAITLTQSNALTGAVTLSNSGDNNVVLTTSSDLLLAASTVGQNLTINSGGALTQNEVLTVPGTSSFTAGANAITLTQNNAFTGAVSLSNSGNNAVSLTDSSALVIGTSSVGTGALNIVASGNISEIGAITQAASSTGVFTLTENTATSNIILNQANNINGTIVFATGATLSNVQDFNLYNTNASASLPTNFSSLTALRNLTLDFNNAAIALPTLALNNGGSISITAGGAISQTGVLTVPGTSSFVTGANAITLTQSNALTGAVTLSNSGTNNVALTTSGALLLAASTVGQNLAISSDGAITQSGILTVPGTLNFTAGANTIILTQSNVLTGTVSLSNSGNNTVSLTDNSALVIGTSSIGTGALNIMASGNISETGGITQTGAGTVTLTENAATSNLTLNQANDLMGTVTFSSGATLGNIQDFNLTNTYASASLPTNFSSVTALRNLTLDFNNAAIALPTLTLNNGGSISITAGGAITQTGILTVPGTSSFIAGANAITLTQSNTLTGAVTLSNSGANNVALTTSGALLLAASTVGQNLMISSGGAITQSGILTVPGTSSFSAGANAITLTQSNALTGAVSLNNSGADAVSLVNKSALALGASSVGSGALNITASGNISETGAITQAASATGIFTLTENTATSNITLNQANNINGAIAFATGVTLGNIQDFNLYNINSSASLPTNFSSLTALRNLTLDFNNAAIALPALTLNNSGSISVTAGGAITQTGVLMVPGTSSFVTGANAITLTQNNALTGAVTLSNSGANNVALTTSSALLLAASTVGQNLTIISGGALTQNGILTVPGTSSFTAGANVITLTQSNALTGAVSLSSSGNNAVSLTDNSALIIGTSSIGMGALNITASGNISETGAITQAASPTGVFTITENATISNIILNQANNINGVIAFATGATLGNVQDFNLYNVNASASLPTNLSSLTSLRNLTLDFNNAAIALPTLTLNNGGALSVTAGGAITQTGILTVPGISSFTAGANAITLTQNNALTGAVTLSNSGANNVALTTSGSLLLAASSVGQNLAITSGGALTQNGILTVPGTSSFTAGANAITLTQNNTFTGAVSLSNSGNNAVSLTDGSALIIGTSSVDTGALNIVASGNISEIGAITQAGAGTVTLTDNTATSNLILNQANDLLGAVTFSSEATLGNIQDFSLTNTYTSATMPTNLTSLTALRNLTLNYSNAAIGLPTLTLNNGGALSVTAGGAITQTGVLTVPGTSSFVASANAITLTQSNALTGAVTLSNSGANNVALTTSSALLLAASTVGQNLTINSGGALTQNEVLTVPGTSSFTAGANAITLTQNNAFTGAVSLSNSGNNAVSLTDSSALVIDTSSIGTGALNIVASGNISEIGAITQAASSTGVFTLTENTATSNIILNQANNINGTIVFATGATLSNVQDFNLYNTNASASLPTNFSSLTALRNLTLDFNNAAIALPTLALNNGGSISITAGGAISQTGVLTVPGTSSFVTGANAITLTQSNALTGAVTLSNSGTNNVALTTSGALLLAASTVGQNLAISSDGAITQSGILTVLGTSSFTAGANAIILTQNNALTGVVSLSNSGNNTVSLTDNSALVIGTFSIGTGALNITASGNISETGDITQTGAGTVTLTENAATSNLTLNQANDLMGTVTFSSGATLGNIQDFNLTNTYASASLPTNFSSVTALRNLTLDFNNAAIALPTLTLNNGGSISITAGGAITQTGILTVPGTSSFIAGANAITLTQSNALTGTVTLSNSGANNVALTTSGALFLAASTVGQNLMISSGGAISQSGILTVPGTSSFAAGANTITLTQSNAFTGAVSLSNAGNNAVALINDGALNIGTATVGSGLLDVTANGALTVSGTVSSAVNGNIQMDANGTETINNTISAGGSGTVTLSATGSSSDLLLDADVTSSSGNLFATAGHNVTLNGGDLSTSGNISLTATAGAIVEVSSVSTNEISSALLTTVSYSGTTLNNANTVTRFNATNSNSNDLSLMNTAETLTITDITQNANGGDINITNTGALTTSGPLSTLGGDVTLTTLTPDTSARTLTVNSTITTAGINAGGNITLTAANPNSTDAALIVNDALDTAPGTGGVLSSGGGVEINVSPVVGAGNITLNAGTGLDLILDSLNVTSNTNFSAPRFIVVEGALTSNLNINLGLIGDDNLNGVGGVLVTPTGSISSGGNLTIVGSNLNGLNGLYGTSDVDSNAGVQIQSGATVEAKGTVSLSEGSGNSNIDLSGPLQSTGANAVTVTPAGTGQIEVGGTVSSAGGAVTLNSLVNLNSSVTVNGGNINFIDGLNGEAYTLTLNGNAASTDSYTLQGTVSFSSPSTNNITINGDASASNSLRLLTSDASLNWNILSDNGGNSLSSNFGSHFNTVQNLQGNSNNDNFIFGNSGRLGGTVTGSSGSRTTLNYNALTLPSSATFNGSNNGVISTSSGTINLFSNINQLIANAATSNTLLLPDQSNSLVISGAQQGSMDSVSFSGFTNFYSTSGNDSVNFTTSVSYPTSSPGPAIVSGVTLYFTNFSPNQFTPSPLPAPMPAPPITPGNTAAINQVMAQMQNMQYSYNRYYFNYGSMPFTNFHSGIKAQGAMIQQIAELPPTNSNLIFISPSIQPKKPVNNSPAINNLSQGAHDTDDERKKRLQMRISLDGYDEAIAATNILRRAFHVRAITSPQIFLYTLSEASTP